MITKIKVKCRKTFVFNERGNTNPDAFIYVNAYELNDAYCTAISKYAADIILVDFYYRKRRPERRYNFVPAWAV